MKRQNVLYTERIELLERKLKALENTDYNTLNSKLNGVLRENQQLKTEIERKAYKRRIPLSPVKIENLDNSSILSMLKQKNSINSPSVSDKLGNTRPAIRLHDPPPKPNSVFMSSSQNQDRNSEGSDLPATQFTMDGDDTGQSRNTYHKPNYKYDESFDPKDNIPIIEESIDLRAHIVEIPPSSPSVKNAALSQDTRAPVSSPTRESRFINKPEGEENDLFEVFDSQEDLDENLVVNFPTPKTATKFQTPSNVTYKLDLKKSHLHTPDDLTPLKKSKMAKVLPLKKENSEKRDQPPQAKLDFTRNPDKNREWIYEDFKIDPTKNDNIDYAYEAVIRGEKRKCQHGVSCKECENFYKAAKGDLIKPNFVGPQWNANSSKSNQEKRDIISKSSRHRMIWDREASPPGFGDFDFPDTQQQMKNKEKSLIIRRKKAYERLYSALNNGKFMFKDERYNEVFKKGHYIIDSSVFERYINVNLGND